MPESRWLGFEAEFGSMGRSAILLTRDGLLPSSSPHGYHCGCDTCEFDSEYSFRYQRDSSTGGEFISLPFMYYQQGDVFPEGKEWMLELERAAQDGDAEVDISAGFHVHVSNMFSGDFAALRGIPDPVRIAKAWMVFEPFLIRWAGPGALNQFRGFNSTVLAVIRSQCYSLVSRIRSRSERSIETYLDGLARALDRLPFYDRHMTVNFYYSNDGRYEFRLWPATRVAWRMEMHARLSVLFTDNDFVDAVGEWFDYWRDGLDASQWKEWVEYGADMGLHPDDDLALEMIAKHDPRAASLLKRQIAYVHSDKVKSSTTDISTEMSLEDLGLPWEMETILDEIEEPEEPEEPRGWGDWQITPARASIYLPTYINASATDVTLGSFTLASDDLTWARSQRPYAIAPEAFTLRPRPDFLIDEGGDDDDDGRDPYDPLDDCDCIACEHRRQLQADQG